ncbi:MAG TPA: alpha-L-rhamnosidase N-terminal domain-containing protein [Chitinophagaceae bacterium]|nr:alpha-L-rhamnosidase N-terminal domain-containing protein [Chitinophagaceae bacterium]
MDNINTLLQKQNSCKGLRACWRMVSFPAWTGLLACICVLGLPLWSAAQQPTINPILLHGSWNAQWIGCPGVPARAYGVYHFRKTIDLAAKPDSFVIHVSADNRYRLYVNGTPVGRGPARSDLYNWNFGTYDIASHLHAGDNVIAAVVWNMAEYAPVAQVSNQTGFLLQGDTKAEQVANTDHSWKVLHDTAYRPCALDMGAVLHSYVAVGAGDQVDAAAYPWGWQQPDYKDSGWEQARELHTPVVPLGYGSDNLWTLVPRSIPQMEEKMQRLQVVRRTTKAVVGKGFLKGSQPLTVAAHSHESILLDQSFETVAYPVLKLSGGKGAKVTLTYAEALFDQNGRKGNRNDIKGKTMKGLYDIFYPDGGKDRTFSPLWIRTYRYLRVDIETGDQPLVLDDIYGMYTGYPFKHKATFTSNDASLEKIWKVGWRTARLCAGETYFDCPYYEQLQYEGDTRIQSLISLYNTGDDRLMRKAINDFYNSRIPDGLTQGRYPSSRLQVIPPFSLFWVSMLYDYWMHVPDEQFLEKYLDAANIVLKWFDRHVDSSYGMLGPMDWWSFVDWNDAFPGGVPDGAQHGHSAVVTLQYAYTLRQAAKLFDYFGRKETADHYAALAGKLAESTYRHCFDAKRMEMANTPEKNTFSQHAGIMAILADAIPVSRQKEVMEKVLYDSTLSQATFYYRFYLTRAMVKAGMGNLYYSQLTPWRDMLKMGLTTFAEKPDPTRSDCHAWSASPEYDFLATICGIMPDAPGFGKVRIAPALGALREVKGTMVLPGMREKDGNHTIAVSLKRAGKDGLQGYVILPENLNGRFIWNGKEIPLHGGKQQIDYH